VKSTLLDLLTFGGDRTYEPLANCKTFGNYARASFAPLNTTGTQVSIAVSCRFAPLSGSNPAQANLHATSGGKLPLRAIPPRLTTLNQRLARPVRITQASRLAPRPSQAVIGRTPYIDIACELVQNPLTLLLTSAR
jgi:hypothetical protein